MNKAKLIEKYQGIFDSLVNMPYSPDNEVLKSRYAEILTDLRSLPEEPDWIPVKPGDELPDMKTWVTFQRADETRFVSEVSSKYAANIASSTLEYTIIAYIPIVKPEPF